MRLPALILAAVAIYFTIGCCPIPIPMDFVVFHGVDVRVTGPDGPVEGATVTMARYEYYPHFRPEYEPRETTVATDERGRASFEEKVESETTAPLMMHGVPAYGWQLCVQAPGHKTALLGVGPPPGQTISDDWRDVEVELETGEGVPCDDVLGRSRVSSADEPTLWAVDAGSPASDASGGRPDGGLPRPTDPDARL